MPNNRIFYPVHTVAMKPMETANNNLIFDYADSIHGVQTMSMTTDFSLEQTNELGTQTIYANVEGVPNVSVDITKVLDGWPTPYLLATQATNAPTLIARSKPRCVIGAAVYDDTFTNSSGTAGLVSVCVISGAYVDSVNYSFGTDGNFTEQTTYVANDKIWWRYEGATYKFASGVNTDAKPIPAPTWGAGIPNVDAPKSIRGIAISDDFNFDLPTGTLTADVNGAVNHPDCTVLPTDIAGISASGTNALVSGAYSAHVSNFTASVSLSREDLNELGRKGPYFRAATFPVEVTSEITAIATEGDLISALENGIFGTGVDRCASPSVNTKDRTIRVVLCEGLRLYLGVKNRLQSVGYSGGDAEGGNVEISYSYTNFNDFTVMHYGDPHFTGALTSANPVGPSFNWNDRFTYLKA